MNNLNSYGILKLTYEIKVNLIREDSLKACKNETKTKTKDNVKELFILTLQKSFFNGIKCIKKIYKIMRADTQFSWKFYLLNE